MDSLPQDWFTLAALVFALGMKHGFDADHLATIDGLTRYNARHNPGLARRCGMLFSIGLVLLAPLASSHPDGLEWVAQQAGFSSLARTPQLKLLPDYLLPGVENQALATIFTTA